MKKFLGVLVCVLVLVVPISAVAIPVDLELALVIDSSGSMSAAEFNTQKKGYVDAFKSDALIDAINQGAIGSIAATVIYFSGLGQQVQAVNWMEITDYDTGEVFANAIDAINRPYTLGMTDIAGALDFTTPLFDYDPLKNPFEGTRQLIDISGDGIDTVNLDFSVVGAARDAALTSGVDTINALLVGGGTTGADFFTDYVIGGTNPFLKQIPNFGDFAPAIEAKLIREVQQPVIPEPSTLLLLGAGLIGVFALGRKKLAKE